MFVTPDEEYVTEETIATDSEALAEINIEENPYELTVELKAAGYVENAADVKISEYSNAVTNDAAFGAVA